MPLQPEPDGPLLQAHRAAASISTPTNLRHYATPPQAALHMAQAIPEDLPYLNILDPGSGAGILSAAICETASSLHNPPHLHIDAWETHPKLAEATLHTLQSAQTWLAPHGVHLTFTVINKDLLNNPLPPGTDPYHLVISNPPYQKLPQQTAAQAAATHNLTFNPPNAYAAFMSIALKHLARRATVVFLVPRSFTSGSMFRNFRKDLFRRMHPTALHLFRLRNTLFQSQQVLQETLIITLRNNPGLHSTVVSHSDSHLDLHESRSFTIPTGTLLPQGPGPPVPIPFGPEDTVFLAHIRSWPDHLASLGLKASTGRIVLFRNTNHLAYEPPTSPSTNLLLMHQVHPMTVNTRRRRPTDPSAFLNHPSTEHLILVPGPSLVTRRFSPKEQRPRIIAAPLPHHLAHKPMAIDNHLNLIHPITTPLPQLILNGLAAFLNSPAADLWTNLHIGNTHVGAADLEAIPVPSRENLSAIANLLPPHPTLQQTREAVQRTINL